MPVDWAELPPEIVETISKRLKIYGDYVRFRAICRSWRSYVSKTPLHLPPQLPWLMLPHSKSHQSQRGFFDLSNKKIHLLNLPEASHGKRRCGSSHGWLAILDETPAVFLVNPLTRVRVDLPPLSSFPNVLRFDYSQVGREYLLRTSTGEVYTRSLRQMRDSFVKKIALSPIPLTKKEFVAVAILNNSGDLAFYKDGDSSWTFIDGGESYCEDVIYYEELIYAVNKHGGVIVCDVHGLCPKVSIIETPRQNGGDMQYLVGSGNKLLLVTRYLDSEYNSVLEEPDIVFKTVRFEVFQMDWDEPKWERLKSLGDRTLFVGENSSLSISASDYPECLGNCIYYTDDYSELNYQGFYGEHDLGIFKLCDESIEPLPCFPRNPHSWRGLPPPLWFTPNPC